MIKLILSLVFSLIFICLILISIPFTLILSLCISPFYPYFIGLYCKALERHNRLNPNNVYSNKILSKKLFNKTNKLMKKNRK
jgi:ABC-type bacteriocin/lantibiotic exporter with double-glycine peptidase domain